MINPVNNPKKIIIHCSDTPDEGDRYGIKDITEWHRLRGFDTCGYHYIIRRTGVVEIGRPETEVGAHVQGHNQDSIGICYIGTNHMTSMQIKSLLMLIDAINSRWQIPTEEIYGHYEFNDSKTCPGQDMNVLRTMIDLGLDPRLRPSNLLALFGAKKS